MSVQKLISNRTSQQSASNSDYTWEYEYYEIGPVSFEGLKANKYSIVIGFWVGLAVFVIFMFFVLTLLTKTGAPHQDSSYWVPTISKPVIESYSYAAPRGYHVGLRGSRRKHRDYPHDFGNAESSEKRFRMNSFVSDFGRPLEPDKLFSRQGNEESRSLFHCYINEVDHLDRPKSCHQTTAFDNDAHFQEALRNSGRPEEELNRLMKFELPNFINTDQNSFGDDDLLISDPPILENKPVFQTPQKDLD